MVVALTPVKDFEYVLKEDGLRSKDEETVLDKGVEGVDTPKPPRRSTMNKTNPVGVSFSVRS